MVNKCRVLIDNTYTKNTLFVHVDHQHCSSGIIIYPHESTGKDDAKVLYNTYYGSYGEKV